MYHYVALLWDSDDDRATLTARRFRQLLEHASPEWVRSFEAHGVLVVSKPPKERALHVYSLQSGRGVILGTLFHTTASDCVLSVPEVLAEPHSISIAESLGRRLLDLFWGCYIAFIAASDERQVVIRDCSGRLPCYRVRVQNVDIVFSDIEDLAPLDLPPFEFNSRYVAAFIYSSQMQVRECGLKGITEILAGECLLVQRGCTEQFALWNPVSVYKGRTIDDSAEATEQLRATTLRCVSCWASRCENILHSLSGGLDSAIVLACAMESSKRPRLTCLNLFTPGTEDDERRYARLSALRAGVPLLERTYAAVEFDERLYGLRKFPKPTVSNVIRLLELDVINEAAEEVDAEVRWTGQGGDHLFWQVRDSYSAVDYAAMRGIGLGLIKAVSDAARLTRTPYASVLRTALRLRHSPAQWSPDVVGKFKPHFVAPEALPENVGTYVTTPIVADLEGIPKGKQLQVYYLLEALNRHRPNPHMEKAYELHPLLSQPLIELCLQIPVYTLLHSGRQRGLARDAFRDLIPPEICRREDKGNTWGRNRELIRGGERFLREALLDGVLVRERIINRASLEPLLVEGQPFRADQFWPLLACVAAEFWSRSWVDTACRIAA